MVEEEFWVVFSLESLNLSETWELDRCRWAGFRF